MSVQNNAADQLSPEAINDLSGLFGPKVEEAKIVAEKSHSDVTKNIKAAFAAMVSVAGVAEIPEELADRLAEAFAGLLTSMVGEVSKGLREGEFSEKELFQKLGTMMTELEKEDSPAVQPQAAPAASTVKEEAVDKPAEAESDFVRRVRTQMEEEELAREVAWAKVWEARYPNGRPA